VREAFKWCVWWVVWEAPYIACGGRFPPSSYTKTCQTAIRRIRGSFPPKCTRTGLSGGGGGGSAEPLVRPAPPCRLWPPSFSSTLSGGPLCWYVGAGASLVSLVCQVGLFCMCYAGRDLLRICLRILRFFFLFRTCAPENKKSSKTTVELG